MPTRCPKGYSLAELPLGLWFFLILFSFPLLSYATIGYRAAILYMATRQACTSCVRQPTFTTAKMMAQQTFKTAAQSFGGIANPQMQFNVVEQPYANTTNPQITPNQQLPNPNIYQAPLQSVNSAENSYYIQLNTTAQLNSLVQFGSWLGMQIPGLTGPYQLTVTCKAIAENPQGLNN